MSKLKLAELIELESELHKRKVGEELQNICTYREALQDTSKEFDFDAAKDYLKKRGYSYSEIENALHERDKTELALYNENGIVKLEDAIDVLERNGPSYKNRTREIYTGIKDTRKFMLRHIRSRNIELNFVSKIDEKVADVKIKGMHKFVSIDVNCVDKNLSYFVDFYSSLGDVEERTKYKSSVPGIIGASFIPIINLMAWGIMCHEFIKDGTTQMGTTLYTAGEENKKTRMGVTKSQIEKNLLFKWDYILKVYEHIVSLKEETERELIKQANIQNHSL